MKLTFVFLVVTGIIFLIKFGEPMGEPKQSVIPQAIHRVIEQHYVKNSVNFKIIYNSNDSDVLDETLKSMKELKAIEIIKVNDDDTTNFHLPHSGIFIIDTLKNLAALMRRLDIARNGPKEKNFLVYCKDLTANLVDDLLLNEKYHWSFLIEEEKEVILKSLTLFTPQQCRTPQLVDVNKFSRKSMQWTDTTFFMTTIRNFHSCPLYFGVDKNGPMVRATISPTGTLFVEGIGPTLFETLASHLNYKVKNVWKNNEDASKTDHDYNSLAKIEGSSYYYQDVTVPVMTFAVVVAVPPGEPYSQIERFFLPFDLQTWIWFTLVFFTAFSLVLIVKLSRSRSLRIFVIGENVSSPALNIFATFMGIGMLTVPTRSISRILLMIFILFSLIMRTAYQGKYFEFLTSDVRKQGIQTVNELIEKNYTLYVSKDFKWNAIKDSYKGDLGSLKVTEVGNNEMYKVLGDLRNPYFKGCALELSTPFTESSDPKYNLLDKVVMTLNYGIGFRPLSFLSSIFRQKIEQLVIAGIWEKIVKPESLPGKRQPIPYNTVLTLQHLSIGFYIWLLMCLLSSLAFTGEILKYWGPKVVRMLFFEYILGRFYKSNSLMH